MDLAAYRQSALEQERITDLVNLVPANAVTILDAGARDGYISLQLARAFASVTALDLKKPQIDRDNVCSVQGDITALEFPDRSFDVVLCAEVLEHLPPRSLALASAELRRVARRHVIIGVPFDQDTRMNQTTCHECGEANPPWGHVNRFDEPKLLELFAPMKPERISFVGCHREYTNALSVRLLEFAGNPYGTYHQEEPCLHCGAQLKPPPPRTFSKKVATRLAVKLNRAQSLLSAPRPNWIHILFAQA